MRRMIVIPVLFMALLASGQERFHAGALAGLSTSQVHGDTYSGFHKAGMMGGLFVNRALVTGGKWDWQMEIMYLQKGSRKGPRPEKGDYTTYLLRLDYAEVPLLLRYRFNSPDTLISRGIGFALEGGAAFGALVHAYEEDEFGPVNSSLGIPFEKWEYSVFLGMSAYFNEKLSLNVRSENSLRAVRTFTTPIYYPNWLLNLFNRGMYNNVLAFSLRYQF